MTAYDAKQQKGFLAFWATLSLALAAIIALLMTAGGCGSATGSNESPQHVDPIGLAEQLCREATDRYERMPPLHITTYGKVMPEITKNERALAERLRRLKLPNNQSIGRLAQLLDRQAREADSVSVTYTHLERPGASGAYKRHVANARRLARQIGATAKSLGVSACAKPPLDARYL